MLVLNLNAAAYAASGLGGVASPRTETIDKLSVDWINASAEKTQARQSLPGDELIRIRCVTTPGDELYIGAEQELEIQAPLAQVEAVLDDFEHYAELFEDIKTVRVIERTGNRVLTFWEEKAPLFFIPNIKHETIYRVDKRSPSLALYTYQLAHAGQVSAMDGLIVLDRVSDTRTRYREIDFLNADWGLAKSLGAAKIWKDSIEAYAKSDVAIKLKAENPAWSHEKARDEASRALRKFPFAERVSARK